MAAESPVLSVFLSEAWVRSLSSDSGEGSVGEYLQALSPESSMLYGEGEREKEPPCPN